jgi:hypothetical protein
MPPRGGPFGTASGGGGGGGGLNEKERMAAIRALQNGSDPVPVLLDPPKV